MTHRVVRALVVEDDISWQQILAEILADMGLVVDVAGNLQAALGIIKTETHRLAIIDLSLVGEDHHNSDGLRVLDSINRSDPACQTVLLTGFATVDLAVSVLTEYRAFSFLRKENFNRAQFHELINRLLASAPFAEPKVIDADILNGDTHAEIKIIKEKGEKVLVVDDDAGWRSILFELLTDSGYTVELSPGFGDALGLIRREKYALAIMDLSLSGESYWEQNISREHFEGYELLASTRSASIPTIVVSGVSSVSEIQRVYAEQGIYAFLEKQSFDRQVFSRLVEDALESSGDTSKLSSLTSREKEVLNSLAVGMTNKEIAEKLVISTNTVKRHLKAIFEKLDVHTRSAAAASSGQRR
jgi:DNA-binding NarL/FixJ family response regulator